MSVRIMSFKASQILWVMAGIISVILVILFLLIKPDTDRNEASSVYIPGVYTTAVPIGDQEITLCLTCSKDEILELEYHVPESLKDVYPLVEACCASYRQQLEAGIPASALTVESAYADTADYIMSALVKLMDMCHM